METKAWWKSKIVWLGILQTLTGSLAVVQDYLSRGEVLGSQGLVLIATGILTVLMRVWFTDTKLT